MYNQTILHHLAFPIRMGTGREEEELRTVVELRRPTAGDLRLADKEGGNSDLERSLFMIGQLCGLAGFEVDRLDASDMTAIGTIIEGFMQPGRPTGTTS